MPARRPLVGSPRVDPGRVDAEVLTPTLATAAELPDDGPMYGWRQGQPGADTVELGYRIVRRAWGRGYATEAGGAAVEHALGTLGATTVVATTMAVNGGSRRVLERLGFDLLGIRVLEWDEPNPGAQEGEAEYLLR